MAAISTAEVGEAQMLLHIMIMKLYVVLQEIFEEYMAFVCYLYL